MKTPEELADEYPPCILLEAVMLSIKSCRYTQNFKADIELAEQVMSLLKNPAPPRG